MILSDAQPVQFWLPDFDTFNEKVVDGVFSKCFCAPFEADDDVTIQFRDTTGLTRTLEIYNSDGFLYSTNFTEVSTGFYQKTITPRDLNITDDEIQFFITDGINLNLAKSDCVSIKENQKETVLINYHNNRILSSLSSEIGTPDPEFNLRIPAVFFKERFPEESEVIKLSNSRSLQLFAEVMSQKLLSTAPMPFYMHKKVKLALSFQTVTIDDLDWIKQEAYEIQDTQRTYPLSKALCWLTEKGYIVRNVL